MLTVDCAPAGRENSLPRIEAAALGAAAAAGEEEEEEEEADTMDVEDDCREAAVKADDEE